MSDRAMCFVSFVHSEEETCDIGASIVHFRPGHDVVSLKVEYGRHELNIHGSMAMISELSDKIAQAVTDALVTAGEHNDRKRLCEQNVIEQ